MHYEVTVPTFEDKILQRAVLMALEPVYEQDFLPCSYGFRPGRSAHQALEALRSGLMSMRGGWIIDLDIEKFFDTLSKDHLRSFLDRRVCDGVIRRAIGKWLNAGVMESGAVSYPEEGTPQGGVISPCLSNVYLHEVLDLWFEHEVKPRLRGRALEVRFADDAVLAKRLEKYGLRLHPEKTRLVDFCRPPLRASGGSGSQRERSFDLLGFTHFWGRSRKGYWVVKRKTAKSRFGRSVRAVSEWCREHRHDKLVDQCAALGRKLQGHYAYYGITGNAPALVRFLYEVRRVWRKWLSRRSHRGRMTWARFARISQHYRLPPPRVVHSIFRRTAIA